MTVLREDGVAMLVYEIALPNVAEEGRGARIAAFYRQMADAYARATANIYEKAQAEYRASQNPRKRFFFLPYQFTVQIKTEEAEDARFLCFHRTARLTRGTEVLRVQEGRDCFLRRTGHLCPPFLYKAKRPHP